MPRSTVPLPAWLAPAAGVGVLKTLKQKADGIEVTFAIPTEGSEAPLTMFVPRDPHRTTCLAVALQELARALLEYREPAKQPRLPHTDARPRLPHTEVP